MTADAATIRARSTATSRPSAATATPSSTTSPTTPGSRTRWARPELEGREAIGGFYDQTTTMADSIELRPTGSVRVAAARRPSRSRPVP